MRDRVGALARRLHETRVAAGFEELSRHTRTPRSTFYVLQKELSFLPNIAYAALGLVHAHLFTNSEEWLSSPYALERAWTVAGPGRRVLYVHCLLPATRTIPPRPGLTVIRTGDVVQELGGEAPPPRPQPLPLPSDPFLVPVSLAALEGKPSLQELWHRIHERLGEQVWSYLPRQRRLRRNGKRYVRRAFATLNANCLVNQHLVRLPGFGALLTVFVLADELLLAALRPLATSIEYYPGTNGLLVRAVGGILMLKTIIASDAQWWMLEDERTACAPRVRVRFEDIHDHLGWRS